MAAVGLLILVAAVAVAVITGLANSGFDHTVRDFSIAGLDMDISSGRVFLYGAVTGAIAMLGLNMVLAGLGRGMKHRAQRKKLLAEERNRTSELEQERERLRRELEEERNSRSDTANTPVDVREPRQESGHHFEDRR